MKALITALLFVLVGLPQVFSNSVEEQVARAEQAYAAGDHAAALALYDSLAVDHTSSPLLFNIGNCYFKLGNVPKAILYYARALRLSPGAEDVEANLELARHQLVDRMNALPSIGLGSLWDRLSGGGLDRWARNSLWAFTAFFLLLGLALWVVKQRLPRTVLLVASGLLLLFTVASVGLAAHRMQVVNDTSEAIILVPKVDVRSEPREGGTVLFVLHEGTKVTIQKEQGGWTEVRIENGSVGWMPPGALEVI